MANLWDELYPGEHARIAKMLIDRVTVYTDRLHLSVRKEGFHSLIAELGDEAEAPVGARPGEPAVIEITIPIELKRRRGRKQIILPPGASARASHEESLDPVVIAVARAHQWRNCLESGRIASISELAKSQKLDGSYVHRILSLTALSPEIIANIVNEKGAGYSLAKLTKGFPAMWSQQEAIFLRKP